MKLAAKILIALVAIEHLWFLVLEMFLFTKPIGLETFKISQAFADSAAALAKNQGLYNGFLAAGLVWSLLAPEPVMARQLKIFFLGCVIAAGLYGGATVDRAILTFQALPALIALTLSLLAARRAPITVARHTPG